MRKPIPEAYVGIDASLWVGGFPSGGMIPAVISHYSALFACALVGATGCWRNAEEPLQFNCYTRTRRDRFANPSVMPIPSGAPGPGARGRCRRAPGKIRTCGSWRGRSANAPETSETAILQAKAAAPTPRTSPAHMLRKRGLCLVHSRPRRAVLGNESARRGISRASLSQYRLSQRLLIPSVLRAGLVGRRGGVGDAAEREAAAARPTGVAGPLDDLAAGEQAGDCLDAGRLRASLGIPARKRGGPVRRNATFSCMINLPFAKTAHGPRV